MSDINQIILLHPKKFVSKSFEAFAKKIPISTYTLNEISDFAYLIDELRPELVLIHEDLVNMSSESYFNQIEKVSFNDFKQVLIRRAESELSSENKDKFTYFIDEPFDMGNLFNILNGPLA